MEKVNSQLPESERFQPLWWYFDKTARLRKEYRRLFPDGQDFKRIYWLWFIGCMAGLGLVLTLKFLL